MGSNMHLKYVHYFGNESNESILEAYGLKTKSEEIDRMKPSSLSQLCRTQQDRFKVLCKM